MKSENRPSVEVYATFGLSKSDAALYQSYVNPLDQECITLNLSIPILDYGARRYKIKQAQLQLDDTKLNLEKDILDNNTLLPIR